MTVEQGDASNLPAVIEFDPGSFVLTAFGRFNWGNVRGDTHLPTASSAFLPNLSCPGSAMTDIDLAASRDGPGFGTYLRRPRTATLRPGSAPRRGALLRCRADVRFYQDLLEFPLTDIFENRDYQGSTHFFFDIGNGNLLAFFDFPGLDLGPYAEVLGGLHHIAISVEPSGGST